MNPIGIFGGKTTAQNNYTLRWVSSAAAGGGDGTTSATSGGTGSWTWAEMLTNAEAGQQVMVQDDGVYAIGSTSSLTGAGGTSSYLVIAGTGNQNGADNNGGRPIIDFNTSTSGAGLSFVGKIVWLERLDVRNAWTDGILLGAKDLAYDVISDSNGDSGTGSGIVFSGTGRALFCESHDNPTYGISATGGASFYGCSAHDNASDGFRTTDPATVFAHCISHDNTGHGFSSSQHTLAVWDCTSEGNGGDAINTVATAAGIGCIGLIRSNHAGAGDQGLGVGTPKLFYDIFGHSFNNADADSSDILQAGHSSGDPDYVSTTGGSEDLTLGASSTADELEIGTPFATNPTRDKGAIQAEAVAGGGGGVIRRIPKIIGA